MGLTTSTPLGTTARPSPQEILVYRSPPTPVKVYRRRLARYSLSFTVEINSTHRNRVSLTKNQSAAAKEAILDPETWRPFLEAMMTQALQKEVASRGSPTPYFTRDVPCPNIQVTLEEADKYKISGRYRGHVEWQSAMCNPEEVGRAAAWHIGDRMAQYGLQNDEQSWWAEVHPVGLHVLLQKGVVLLEGA
jgi:hypothetical protein